MTSMEKHGFKRNKVEFTTARDRIVFQPLAGNWLKEDKREQKATGKGNH